MKVYAMVEYINRYGKISIKGFADYETTRAFVERLATRKAKYLLTIL